MTVTLRRAEKSRYQRIREARKLTRNLVAENLSTYLGRHVNPQTLVKLEQGRMRMSDIWAKPLAQIYGVSVGDFVDETVPLEAFLDPPAVLSAAASPSTPEPTPARTQSEEDDLISALSVINHTLRSNPNISIIVKNREVQMFRAIR